MTGQLNIVIQSQQLTLLPQRALFWHEQKMLILADPHFGKAATFRAQGIAVPSGMTADDLSRLDRILEAFPVASLLVLGDLFHSSHLDNHLLARIRRWRAGHDNLEIVIVRGNHDRWRTFLAADMGFETIVDFYRRPPFQFTHLPRPVLGDYVLSGHLHPAVYLTGPARQQERLACFYFGKDYAILPAFGSFTGLHTIQPLENDRVFGIVEGCVVAL